MNTHESSPIFATTNRHLENFLFMHRIRFSSQEKTEDGVTKWSYFADDAFNRVLTEYKQLYPKGFRA